MVYHFPRLLPSCENRLVDKNFLRSRLALMYRYIHGLPMSRKTKGARGGVVSNLHLTNRFSIIYFKFERVIHALLAQW